MTARHNLEQYLHSTDDKTAKYCCLTTAEGALFLRMDVTLPASAAVEQLFSSAGLVMAHKWTKIMDKHFENLVFLKSNKGLTDRQQINVTITCDN